MEKLDDLLRNVQLPTYALFKNLVIDPTDIQAEIVDFESATLGESSWDLEKLLPLRLINPDGTEEVKHGVNRTDLPDDVDEESFNTTLEAWEPFQEYSRDYRDLGESYTILWICPPDKDFIVEKLLAVLAEDTTLQGKPITAISLSSIWEDYLDRLQFYPSPTDEEMSMGILWQQIANEFEARVRSLPNAPPESEWVRMFELSSWG